MSLLSRLTGGLASTARCIHSHATAVSTQCAVLPRLSSLHTPASSSSATVRCMHMALSPTACAGPSSAAEQIARLHQRHQQRVTGLLFNQINSMSSRQLSSPYAFVRRGCQTTTARQSQHRASAAELGLYWGAAAVGMIGVSYASVPLYKMFCAATGYGGAVRGLETVEEKLKRRQEKPNEKVEKAAADREVTVWFNGDVAQSMPWEFKPTQEFVRVKPGQSTLVFFTAKNNSDQAVTGYSVYNVTPDKAAVYFNKIQCFCFEMQRLRAKEEIDMPVFFYLDPELATDWNCRNVDDITLSYTFHKVDDEDLDDYEDDGLPTVVKLHGPEGVQLPHGLVMSAVPIAPGSSSSQAAAVAAAPAPATSTA